MNLFKNIPKASLRQLSMICTLTVFGLASHASIGQSTHQASDDFPDISKSYLRTGQFVRPDNVRRVELGAAFKSDTQEYAGMHKDQVRLELSHPHFDEGIRSNKVWNYVFNFYTGVRSGKVSSREFETCQFKVVFNDHGNVERVQWKNPQCATFTNPPVVKPLN